MFKHTTLFYFIIAFTFVACQPNEKASLIIHNAVIYTVDKVNPESTTLAVKDDRIIAIGNDIDIASYTDEGTVVIDADGAFVMPGFIEGHGHFSGLGYSLINLNFLDAKNWGEVIKKVEDAVKEAPEGAWIEGRGWHQEKWDEIPENSHHGYPQHHDLSRISPDNPVVLFHASGHSLFANEQAMKIAGVNKEMANPMGGEIVRNDFGEAIGVFEERAMTPIRQTYQSYKDQLNQEERKAKWDKAIALAQGECLKKGITSFQDAGSTFEELDNYAAMAENNQWDVRLWAMVRHSAKEMKNKVGDYKTINAGNNHFTCCAIKSEVDGALGAFGAWLLEPYTDKPGFNGQNTTDIYEVKEIADIASENDMQLCVHAIGDRANRVVLDIYENILSKHDEPKAKRWRIEHAQHLDTSDIPRFADYGIIASMQGIHCTSDAPFVEKRLGFDRSKYGAYPWRSLLDAGVIIANGTDAPVEDVDPLKSFYASVTRKRADNGMEFFTEQSMTREEAIYSYTLGNAFAAFEEEMKGSLTVGKLADIVILSNNLVECSDDAILETEVLYTIVGGEVKYSRD